jgi:adiponectin receptor
MAYSTLKSVRDSCYNVSDEVMGAGRRRANIIIEELDKMEWYKEALARKDTMEQKVQEGVKIMEGILLDFEHRAYATRDSSLAAAGDFITEVKREVDVGIEMASELVGDAKEAAKRAKEALRVKIDEAIISARKHGLITYADLPEPWRVNPHIVKGYRFHSNKIDCVKSMLHLTNETTNIWTHLVGLGIVAGIALHYYPTSEVFHLSTTSDVLIAAVFFVAAAKCLICSCLWHTMSSISDQPLMERFACVDYTGISMLVASSIMTTEWNAFYCQPVSRWVYMGLTLALGIGGTIVPWHPFFNRAENSWLRVVFYCSLALTGFIPIFQLSWTRGWTWVAFFYGPVWKSVSVYFTGAVCEVFLRVY